MGCEEEPEARRGLEAGGEEAAPPDGTPRGDPNLPRVCPKFTPGVPKLLSGVSLRVPPRPVRGGAEGGDSPTSLGGVSPEPGRPAGVRRRQERGAERG